MKMIKEPDFAKTDLNLRNAEGQSSLYMIIKMRREKMFKPFFEKFKEKLDLRSRE